MSGHGQGPAWDELGKIDYLLDELARAVERGDTPRETYDALAPRYLERRAELVAAITAGGAPRAAAGGGVPGALTAAMPRAAAGGVAPAPAIATRAPHPHREVRWTQVLAYTGAFLVVVAAAIFTVAVWETVSTTAKLAFLGGFTAAFYAAGAWVWRAGLRGTSVALTAVGSALLLFDGWIAIDGYGLAGPWPWAVLLLVLSAVYWFTETRLSGRFFGVTGAAAQVGWWWLLGQGLGWTPAPRLAGIAVVALGWSLAAERVRGREEFASLASVLRIAAPVTAALASAGILADVAIGPPRWAEVASAGVAAVALTAVLDRAGARWRGAGALGWLVLLVVTVSMIPGDGAGWGHVGVLAAAALATGAYELSRGGTGHGVAALVLEFAAWLALADLLSLPDDATLALLVLVAGVWFVAARLLDDPARLGEDAFARNGGAFAAVVRWAAWLLLGGATLFVPDGVATALAKGWGLPVPREAALAAVFTLGWAAGARIARAWPAGVLAVLGSYLTVALLVSGLFAEVEPAWIAVALTALSAVWLHLPRLAEGLSAGFASRGASWVGGATLLVVALALWADSPWSAHASLPLVALFVALATLWLSEAIRYRTPPAGAPAAVALVLAVMAAVGPAEPAVRVAGGGWAGVAGAAAGAALALGAGGWYARRRWLR